MNINRLKISAVSYLNTKPFLFGLENSPLSESIDLQLDIPSECAQKLATQEVDLGLVPVAVIPQIKTPYITSDYCIGTLGTVKTVCIYSHCPIQEVEALYLDYHSRTSVALTKYLLKNYWHISPQLIAAKAGFEQKIQGNTAALIIGDRTIGLEEQYPYIYDLGEIWNTHTNLPFVFAAWVSNKPLSETFVQQFNQALKKGIAARKLVAEQFQKNYSNFSIEEYYFKYIHYELDYKKKEALQLFLDYTSPNVKVLV